MAHLPGNQPAKTWSHGVAAVPGTHFSYLGSTKSSTMAPWPCRS
ncbi:hypothetical protein LI90_866 [Carbonactinospora thermoautotrophica]|uniref:Uncharacterized protein n=1 Tax=Carbonactinospora thermoautotrophica TaxID=1469144 RepID=A0A132MMZ9_9ACTN|nr:hypothetical protein LI90_866 [Carbonactinospora thermoautotrophica]